MHMKQATINDCRVIDLQREMKEYNRRYRSCGIIVAVIQTKIV